MKGVLDSSVLVPVFYGEHVHHLEQAMLFIGSLLERPVQHRIEWRGIRAASPATLGIVGGGTYDAMLVHSTHGTPATTICAGLK